MKSLTQKRGSKKIIYTVADTGLSRKIITNGGDSEFHYPFEQLKNNRASALEHNQAVLVMAGIFGVLALLIFIISFLDRDVEPMTSLVCFIVSIPLFIYYFKTRTRKLYLQTAEGAPLEFLATTPSKEEVNEFIDELLQQRDAYLLSRYGQLTRNLDYGTQFENLNWLLSNRVISKAQYDEKMQELNGLFSSHNGGKPIGFASNK